jgi:hypothetical protein
VLLAAVAIPIGYGASVPDVAEVAPAPLTVERDVPTPGAEGPASDDPSPAADQLLEARAVATLAIGDQVSGSDRALALVDVDGLRIVDLRQGTVSEPTALGPVDVPILVAPDGGSFVFVSRGVLTEVDVEGGRRSIGAAHGAAVGLDQHLVWMLFREGELPVLTAVGRSSGVVIEEIALAHGDALVGFHAGRPLVASGDTVIRHDPAGASVAVTTGRVVATGGGLLLVRRCPEPGCDEAVVVDLDGGSERTVELDAEVQAFGLGEALSPDGRWLVGLVFGDHASPEVAIHPLVEPGAVPPEPLVLSLGVLGFGGRAAGVTWSPDAALLAAPGSSRVALVDVEKRSTVTIPIRLSGSGPTVRWLAS